MARTRPETEWGFALRQACLASALGLGELAGSALDPHVRALRGETREMVEAARRLLAPPDDEVERLTDVVGREPRWAQPFRPERGATLDEQLIVALEEPIEGAGWREPHRPSSGFPGRFMGPGRRAWVDLPVRLPPACRIELVVESDDLGLADALALEVNGVPVEVEWLPQGRRRLGRAAVPDDYATSWPFTRIEMTTLRLVPRPGPDPRKLGLALSELRLIPPDGEGGGD